MHDLNKNTIRTQLDEQLKLISERRHSFDTSERSQLQKCLDAIQKNIRITSLQSMVERLETICRQIGLRFIGQQDANSPECYQTFITSEMFYVEIMLNNETGFVIDCKVAHHADLVVCLKGTWVTNKPVPVSSSIL